MFPCLENRRRSLRDERGTHPLRSQAAAVLIAWCAASSYAQSGGGYNIKKSTIDGGGSKVIGGEYVLNGTVGQHDAGPISGGGYALTGGFWSASAEPSVSPPTVPPAPHDRRKNRYISFNPNNPTGSVAFRVARTTAPTGSCWVQAPVAAGADINTSTCGANPVFRVWTEPVLHVGDCEIIPVVDYMVFANAPGPIENPVGLAVPTILVPSINGKLWADSVGSFNGMEWTPPNQIGNVNDVLAILARIAASAGSPQFVVANLGSTSSADSCLTAQVNTADTLAAVQAVSGNSYGPPSSGRFTTFAQCAVTPTGACVCCGN